MRRRRIRSTRLFVPYLSGGLSINQAMNQYALKRYSDDISQEVDRISNGYLNNSTIFSLNTSSVLVLSHIHSPHRVVNLVASSIRNRLSTGFVCVSQSIGEILVVEMRRTRDLSSYDLKSLLDRIVLNVNVINYGGHAAAVGLSLQLKHKELLENVIVEEINRIVSTS